MDFCEADFGTGSRIWNNEFWANDEGFLFRIQEKWGLVDPTTMPIDSKNLSNGEAWRWFERNEITPPTMLVAWRNKLKPSNATFSLTDNLELNFLLAEFAKIECKDGTTQQEMALEIAGGLTNYREFVEHFWPDRSPEEINNMWTSFTQALNKKLAAYGKKLSRDSAAGNFIVLTDLPANAKKPNKNMGKNK